MSQSDLSLKSDLPVKYHATRKFRLGLVINPYAGIGGAMALKGSDGADIRSKALAAGAEKKANLRTQTALEVFAHLKEIVQVYTASGEMGEDVCKALGFETHIVYQPHSTQTEAEDTENTVKALVEQDVDLLLFAGGDGTARNVCSVIPEILPALGIPAGVKIHSGVYAITPKAAGRVVENLLRGEIVSLDDAQVMDIDEVAFREGKVRARQYGAMRIPAELHYVQAVKNGGKEVEELVLADIAAHVIEMMDDELFIMGSGTTVAAVMEEMGLDNTLLGVDVIQHQELLAADLNATELLNMISEKECKLVITLIGGQGHIFGRGNQQLSPAVIRAVGRENIILVATKSKLQALNGRPLLADTGDEQLNAELAGLLPVITGYHDQVLYPVAEPV
ncbi:ATP-NAD kinase family protein [Planctobacterium marinum]|uniref:ATP-NAD kinase n=1 Tax=Planctobacterium marinum TaxID=1631968 RepID=A0AA48KSR9_9ALTE|nr:ATP-NAD kinase [Planctobacterium marinum]